MKNLQSLNNFLTLGYAEAPIFVVLYYLTYGFIRHSCRCSIAFGLFRPNGWGE